MAELENILESLYFSASRPISTSEVLKILDDPNYDLKAIKEAILNLEKKYQDSSFELVKVASGHRFRIKQKYSPWISKLWSEKPQKYSRALLETLSLIAYKQPVTRGEIEEVRRVSGSSQIIRTLLDRYWIKVVGHRDVPGRPALLATTKEFLDDLNISKLSQLPELPEIRNIQAEPQMNLLEETQDTL